MADSPGNKGSVNTISANTQAKIIFYIILLKFIII